MPAYEYPDILNLFNSSKILFFPISIYFLCTFFYKASALGSVASSAMAKGNYYCFIFQNQENFPDSTMGFNKVAFFYRKLNSDI